MNHLLKSIYSYFNKYLSSKVIFALDLIVSLAASLLAMTIMFHVVGGGK